ncbi:sodium:solute symporter [Robiginitalea marina]|uniref:Sodium:solute symporter n=1 Tax=Robiginitalea marina TaxID=2954105 RepID=A0ABT1AZT1_9FLAO|nr:sodium:solute symporter [Robiginitalea marina]MCO5725492.1 sodium:solute symporter [Robiginitalea marina]
MTPAFILALVGAYFLLLLLISYFTGKNDSNEDFFRAGKSSPWYLVAFGMIGASLSGVTFISVPGAVQSASFSYMQVVMGYLAGYLVISFVLLPIYYRLNVTSIYEYLEQRFGWMSYKIGALSFFISRVLGAAFRLFLVALVLQQFVFDAWGVPFELTVVLSIALIWVYTFRGGIKTIVWTDTLQTFFMLASVGLSIYFINQRLGWGFFDFLSSPELGQYSKTWFTGSWNERNHLVKSFVGGMFITICMTGLDQDMMQKNLTCRSLKEARMNMISFSLVLVVVNLVFLLLGALLFIYAEAFGVTVPLMDGSPKSDLLFPEIALNTGLGRGVAVTFMLGLIAAAYSSADSALTSLTTSFCVDFLGIQKKPEPLKKRIRKRTHLAMSALLIAVVILFKYVLDRNVIDGLLTVATYTYGPLLGLFSFGIFTRYQLKDSLVWAVALGVICLVILIANLPPSWLGGYQVGYELLPLNGLLTFAGLWLIRDKGEKTGASL